MILITGSTGYIGSHLTNFFEKNKIKYVGIDNLSYSYKSNILNKNKHFYFDISDKKKLLDVLKKFKPHTIIHAAASSYVVEAEKKKKKYYSNNVINTKIFIDVCDHQKIKNFIFLSSSNVYNENKRKIGVKENSITKPKNYYGKNKLIIEKYLKKKSFRSLVILRLFNVIGIFNKKFKPFTFKKENYQRLIFKILQNFKNNQNTNINFVTKNKKKTFPSRDFINILDLMFVINKVLKILKKNKNKKLTLNVGSGESTSINLIINFLEKKIRKNLNVKLIQMSKKELIYTKSSTTNLKKILDYKPKLKLEKTIESHIKFLNLT